MKTRLAPFEALPLRGFDHALCAWSRLARSADRSSAEQEIDAMNGLHQQLETANEPYWPAMYFHDRETMSVWVMVT